MLNAEALRRAFAAHFRSGTAQRQELGDNVHGQLGLVDDWDTHRPAIARWLATHRKEVSEIARRLVEAGTAQLEGGGWEAGGLRGDQALGRHQRRRREVRPIRRGASASSWPTMGCCLCSASRRAGSFSRGVPSAHTHGPPRGAWSIGAWTLAITQFAPGSETVKDKAIHTAVGVASYAPRGGYPDLRPEPTR